MQKYEIMFIVKPTIEEEAIKKTAEEMKNVVEKAGGKIVGEKAMGQREMAYEIEGHKKGYYYLYTIEAEAKIVEEINRVANVSEEIIRHIVIKVEK